MRLNELRDKRVVIWGGGVEGLATAAAIRASGADVSIAVDDKTDGEGSSQGIKQVYADEAVARLLAADVVVKSPGISLHVPMYKRLEDASIPITTATELWFADHAQQTIGITGTKGKSTTVSLLGGLLQALGFDSAIGGNVGVPLLSLPQDKQWYVAELSSYQCASLEQSPYIAVFTSLYPEHLPWHGSLDAYYDAKMNLAAHNPHAIIANGENKELHRRLPAVLSVEAAKHLQWVPSDRLAVTEAAIELDGRPFIESKELRLLGRHNLLNIALCLQILSALGVDVMQQKEKIRSVLQAFEPLAHRLQFVGQYHALRWVNDSLSTTPHSAIAALELFEDEPSVSIILGGQDRGVSYEPLRDYFRQRKQPVSILTIPDSGKHIAEVIGEIQPHEVYQCRSLQEAVEKAVAVTKPMGVVILSPAAPSFDHYKDYKDRGSQFMDLARSS